MQYNNEQVRAAAAQLKSKFDTLEEKQTIRNFEVMPHTYFLIQINIAPLDHVYPGITIKNISEVFFQPDVISATIKRIVHPAEADAAIDVFVSNSIA